MPNPMPAVLARAFSRDMSACLSPLHLSEVVRRNALQANPSICHSHDFCDANMVMNQTLQEFGVVDFDVADEAGQLAMCRLWNEAWGMAKQAGFDEKAIRD